MKIESAEMTKHALNAFLATSVTFINEIASLCETVGANAYEVEQGLKSDIRIGKRAYLSPGTAYAGGTLARDILYLENYTKSKNLNYKFWNAIRNSNNKHKSWIKNKLYLIFGEDFGNINITIWGLTYKPQHKYFKEIFIS